jgi:hypothetical protein
MAKDECNMRYNNREVKEASQELDRTLIRAAKKIDADDFSGPVGEKTSYPERKAAYIRALLLTGDRAKAKHIAALSESTAVALENTSGFRARLTSVADELRHFLYDRMLEFTDSRHEDIALRATEKLLERVERTVGEDVTIPSVHVNIIDVVDRLSGNPLGAAIASRIRAALPPAVPPGDTENEDE